MSRRRFDWWGITIYAAAMAFVETACVVSLKRLYFPEGWRPPFHVIPAEGLRLEQAREIATLVMIAAVAFLGRPAWREGLARFLWVFAIWDLLYYVFLRFLTRFPSGLGDLDIVFLVPHEWIFPVWIPFTCSVGSLVVALRLHRSGTRGA